MRKVLQNGTLFANERLSTCDIFPRPQKRTTQIKGVVFMPIFYIVSSIIVFATLATLIVAFILKRKILTVNKVNNVRRIVYIAIFSALMALLNFASIDTPVQKLTFTMCGACLVGIMFGGTDAFIICFFGDLITGLFMYGGWYNPFIGIASGLFGFIFGSVYSMKYVNRYLKVVIGYAISFVICTVLINTFALYFSVNISFSSKMSSEPFMAFLLSRSFLQLPVVGANLAISLLMLEISVKLKNMLYSRLVINFTHTEVETESSAVSSIDAQIKLGEDDIV